MISKIKKTIPLIENRNAVIGVGLLLAILLLGSCAAGTIASEVDYPKGISFEERDAQRANWKKYPLNREFGNRLNSFSYDFSAAAFETMPETERYATNHIISPLSLYYGLAMAYSGAEGETISELSDLLHMDGMELGDFLEENHNLYNRLYADNEVSKLKIANSIWVQEAVTLKPDYSNDVMKYLYASVHPVDFAKQETAVEIGQWLTDQTGGMLNDAINVEPSSDHMMFMYNTIYFSEQWVDEFQKDKNDMGIFHRWDGTEVETEYMNRVMLNTHWHGDDFHMVSLSTKGQSTMVLVQPDEGVDLYEWLSKPDNIKAINSIYDETLASAYGMITLGLPKFDYSGSIDVKKVLEHQGVSAPFASDADFTEIADEDTLFIDNIRQKTRISIDEKGVEAATFTELFYAGSAQPEEDLEMILDRPFIIGVVNNHQLVFVGVVNDPTLN